MFTKLIALLALVSSTAHAAYFPTFEELVGHQIATPANPPANYNKVYVKSDGKLYILNSAGVETQIGSGSGDVVGPASAVDGQLVQFDLTTGKLIKAASGSGFVKATAGVPAYQASIAIGSDVSGLGANVATFLGTPSSANLAAALTDESGTGAAVFANSPVLVTPDLGTPSALVGTNISGTAAALNIGGNAATVTTNANLTGPVTSVGNATSVANNAITNAMLDQMAQHTFKGNNTGATANALDLTATQLTAELNSFVGDSGAGGTKGLVPAPASGDAAANKYLHADGTWRIIAGGGDVSSNTATSVVNEIALFADTSGKLLKRSTGTGVLHVTSGVASASNVVNADVDAAAAIARSKLASGSNNHVIINDGSGVLSSEAVLAISRGGTGLSSAGAVGNVLTSDGTNWVSSATSVSYDTAWVAYTATITGAGSETNKTAFWRRVGDSMQIRLNFTTGTASGSAATATLPAGYSIDTAKMPSSGNAVIGVAEMGGTTSRELTVLFKPSDATKLYFGVHVDGSGSGGLVDDTGSNVWNNSSAVSYVIVDIPIATWTASGVGAYAKLYELQANTTTAGGFTASTDTQRVLNVEEDTSGIVTLSSNQFTLVAGTYRIKARAPAFRVDFHKAKLRNVTDSTDTIIGSNAYSVTATDGQTDSFIDGEFTIAGTKTFEISHRCSTTKTVNGLGINTSLGTAEIYTVVEIWKIQ